MHSPDAHHREAKIATSITRLYVLSLPNKRGKKKENKTKQTKERVEEKEVESI